MTQITTEQYELIVNEIYRSIMGNPDMGMGEMGEARDEGKRIVEEWMEKTGITFEATSEERGQDGEPVKQMPFSQRTKADIYREYVNDWPTVSAMAENYGRTEKEMYDILDAGKIEHEAVCTPPAGKEAIGEQAEEWAFNQEENTVSKYRVYSTKDGRTICWVDPDDESKETELADITLIASAPALVKENQQLKDDLSKAMETAYQENKTAKQQAKDIQELREALDAVLTEISPAYNFDLRNAPEPIKKGN